MDPDDLRSLPEDEKVFLNSNITKFCLLTNDALNAAAMKVNRITQMATNDGGLFQHKLDEMLGALTGCSDGSSTSIEHNILAVTNSL